jgi:hypothetical protein
MDHLTQQLSSLSHDARSSLKEFFEETRKQSGKITDLAHKIRANSKPQLQVTKKSPHNNRTNRTATEDQDLDPMRQAANIQAQAPIQVTRTVQIVEQAQRSPASRSKLNPLKSLAGDDYDQAVDDSKREQDSISPQSGPEDTKSNRAKPSTPTIDREIYTFDQDHGVRADPHLTVADAEALLDLLSGMEGQKVPNGENLLITSNGQKLFETDAEGVITYSINQQQASFDRSPINNSLNQMREHLSSFVQTQRRVKTDIQAGVKNAKTQSTTETAIKSPTPAPNPANNNPAERLDQAITAGNIKRTSAVNPISEQAQNQLQTESLLTLRDQLQDGGVLTDGKSKITLETQSKGSNIKLSEPGQKPISLGKVSNTGIVTLGTQYTNQRTATVENLIQNGQVQGGKQQPSEIQAVTNGNAPSKSNIPSNSNAPSTGNAPTEGNSPKSGNGHNAYSYQDIKQLNHYYNSPAYQESPLKPGATSKVTPQQARARLEEQKSQLLNSARQDLEQKGGLSEGQSFNNFNDDFFKNFSSEAVTLSAQEQTDLASAKEFAASNKAKPERAEVDVNNQTQTLKR